jgi:hypothetical protein
MPNSRPFVVDDRNNGEVVVANLNALFGIA